MTFRILLGAAAALCIVAIGITLADGGEAQKDAPPPPATAVTTAAPASDATPPGQLPGGARSILPEHRVVAYYGAPQAHELGVLGIGAPEEAAEKLRQTAEGYEGPGRRPVMRAFELIASIAAADPGDDGKYRTRQSDEVIRRYLAAARAAGAILILDIQPGRSDFVTEAQALSKYLVEPDVGLALDPEWRMRRNEVPGKVIGSVDAGEVNRVNEWLSGVAQRRGLPDKLVIVHQFTGGMIRRKQGLKTYPGLDQVLNADGFGSQELKTGSYRRAIRGRGGFHTGFKLFYEEDTGLMTPSQVLALRPSPEVVLYE